MAGAHMVAKGHEVSPGTAPSRRRRWRPRRWLIVAAALAALVALSPTLLSLGPAAWIARAAIRKRWPGPVEIGRVALWWSGRVRVADVVLGDPDGQPLLTVDSIEARPRLSSLLGSHPRLGTVHIRGASAVVDLAPGGGFRRSLQALGDRGGRNGKGDLTADVELLNSDVTLAVPGQHRPVRARIRSASAKVTSLRAPIAVRLVGEVAQGEVLADGSITLPPASPLTLDRLNGSINVGAQPEVLADLQPLLTWLGVPLGIDGRGEFVANLAAKQGAYEAALKVTDAHLRIQPAGAEKPVETQVTDALATFKGLNQPIILRASGRVARAPVEVRVNLTLPPDRSLRPERLTGAAQITAAAPDLADLNPLLAAVRVPIEVNGRGAIEANALAGDGTVNLAGLFKGQDITLTRSGRRDQHLDLARPDLQFDITYDARSLVGRVDLTSAPVRAKVLGRADLEPDTSPRRSTLVAEVHTAVPQLVKALPGAFRLREGLTLEDGRIDATVSLEHRGQDLDANGIVDVADLRGTVGDRPVTLDEPVRAVVDVALRLPQREATTTATATTAPRAGGWPSIAEVRHARFQSGFATLRGSGDRDEVTVSADYDLAKLDRTLRQFLDLGEMSLAGQGGTTLSLRRKEPAVYAVQARSHVTHLAVSGLSAKPIREPQALAEVTGVVRLGAGRHVLALDRVLCTATGLSVSGSGAVHDLGRRDFRLENVDLVTTADLARLAEGLGRPFLPAGVRLAGQAAVRTAGAGSPGAWKVRQEITGTGLSAAGLVVDGRPVSLRCDQLTLEHETALTHTDRGLKAEVSRWTMRSSLLDGQGSATVTGASPLRVERSAAQVARLDLGLAAEGLRALLPEGLTVRGTVGGEVTLAQPRAGEHHVGLDLATSGLATEGGPLRAPWAGGDVAVAVDGDLAREGGGWRLAARSFSARTTDGRLLAKTTGENWVRTDGTGRVAAALTGQIEELPRLLGPFLRWPLDEEEISLAGTLAGQVVAQAAPGRVTIETGEVVVRDLVARGTRVGPEPFHERELRLAAAGEWDDRAGSVEVSRATVRSTLLTANVENGRIEYGKEGLTSARAKIAGSGDLARACGAFGRLVGLPEGTRFAGRFTIDHQISSTGTSIRFAGRIPIEGFVYQAGNRRFAEPLVEVEHDLTYDTAARSLSVRKGGVRAGAQAVVASGTIDDLTGRRRTDLTVGVAYDAAELAGRLRDLLPGDLTLTGRRQVRVSLGGALAGRTWREMVKGLAGRGQLGLDTIAYQGVAVSQPTVTFTLADGHVRLGPDRWAINRGAGELLLDLDLTADPIVAAVPRPIELAHQVDFDKHVASQHLKYLCPLFAEVGRARGTVTLGCQSLRLPLDRHWQQRLLMTGTVQFNGVELDSSNVVRLILLALKQRPTGVVGDIPAFPVSVRAGRFHYGSIRIPVKDVFIELTGSAGFDGTLDLAAAVPLTESAARGLSGDQRIARYLTGARVRIHIGGTFENPTLDERVVQRAIDGLIRDALKKAAQEETRRLLERWLKDRTP